MSKDKEIVPLHTQTMTAEKAAKLLDDLAAGNVETLPGGATVEELAVSRRKANQSYREELENFHKKQRQETVKKGSLEELAIKAVDDPGSVKVDVTVTPTGAVHVATPVELSTFSFVEKPVDPVEQMQSDASDFNKQVANSLKQGQNTDADKSDTKSDADKDKSGSKPAEK